MGEVSGRPGARAALRAGQVLVALVSAAVLGLTGYAWGAVHRLTTGISTSDVIDHQADGTTSSPPLDGATDILVVGLDSRTDAQGNPLSREVLDQLSAGESDGELNTDTMILLHIPNDPARTAVALSIPRDSYVPIADGFGTHKINSAYARQANTTRDQLAAQGVTGAALTAQAMQAGRRTLIRTVQDLTGVTIDHYAEVNLLGFAQITQAIGGVRVCLKAPVRDEYSGADFPAGPQTVQGVDALRFVRQRHGLPNGDLDRVVRQQVFLAGLAQRVLSAGTLSSPGRLADLVAAIDRSVVLDQGWDLVSFAQRVQGRQGDSIRFGTIPTVRSDLWTPEDGVAVQVDPQQVRAAIAAFTAGSSPSGEPPETTTANREQVYPQAPHATDPSPTSSTPPAITADGLTCVN